MTPRSSGPGRQPGQGKAERYMKPALLLALKEKEARYGYELLATIEDFGFLQGKTPPGMVYRHLRQLEEDGFVSSTWQTEESGPAKRVYTITTEGEDALAGWVDFMEQQAMNLKRFVERYRSQVQSDPAIKR
jgi:PadR family transcriptional regulator, regulatory protein PadR